MSRLADRISGWADPHAPGSLSASARARRWCDLVRAFPRIGEMRVLDLGGDARAWRACGVRPAHVTLLNRFPQEPPESWMSAVRGDACSPPADLGSFDLVYSNSVIEHVGGHWRRERFAAAVRDVAPRYWVQTPNRWFPLEPHFLVPGLQHLPRWAQVELIRRWPLGGCRAASDRAAALAAAQEVELLSALELRGYFPDATVRAERVAGLAKSLIALRAI